MTTRLLLDNWTLVDAEALLENGYSPGVKVALNLEDTAFPLWREVDSGVVQTRALLRLLIDIITRDELVVDKTWQSTWGGATSPMDPLLAQRIVTPFEFAKDNETTATTSQIVRQLCTTPSLLRQQDENEVSWMQVGQVRHHAHSLILWGGAGYLMRSRLLQLPYSPHPLRAAALETTGFANSRRDMSQAIDRWLQDQRSMIINAVDPTHSTAGAILPPLAVAAIGDATTPDQLIPVALQMRDDYADLRKWIGKYQEAVEAEDITTQKEMSLVLRSVENEITRKLGKGSGGSTALSVSVQWLGISLPAISPLELVRNRVGVRALLNRLAFTPSGRKAVEKLVALFGEGRSRLGGRVVAELTEGHGAS